MLVVVDYSEGGSESEAGGGSLVDGFNGDGGWLSTRLGIWKSINIEKKNYTLYHKNHFEKMRPKDYS